MVLLALRVARLAASVAVLTAVLLVLRCHSLHSLQFVPMLGECILCSVHVFPGVEHVISNPNVYLLLVCSMFLRLYVVGRFRFHHSTMGQAPGRFIAGLTNTHLNFAFLVRALLEYNPYSVTLTFFTVCMVVAAYLLRVAETVVCASDKHLQCVPLTFTDSLWTLLITVTTVGYGGGSAAASGWGRACTAFLSVVAFLVLAVRTWFGLCSVGAARRGSADSHAAACPRVCRSWWRLPFAG